MRSDLQNPCVLAIGAGIEQVPAIRTAIDFGAHVVALDGNAEAPGLELAGTGVVTDLRDLPAVIDIARQHQPRVVLPVPLGAVLVTAGAVNDALGLPGISEEAARRCADKALLHSCLESAGVRVPETQFASTSEEILRAAAQFRWRAVVKPVHGSGSRGVFLGACEEDFRDIAGRQETAAGPRIVQQLVEGREIGVDGLVRDGRPEILLVRDKEISPPPQRLPLGFSAPAELPPVARRALEEILPTACAALGLEDCPFHADVMLPPGAPDSPVVIELCGRPSGFHLSSRMLPALTGRNIAGEALRRAGFAPAETRSTRPATSRAAHLGFLEAPAGEFLDLEGLDEVRSMDGILAAECFLKPGSPPYRTTEGRVAFGTGYILAAGPAIDDAKKNFAAAAAELEFVMKEPIGLNDE